MMQTLHQFIAKDGFRLRGTEMSRIDGFSDVVFGFALTLIVASLEVPKTYAELHEILLGFFPFAICFIFLFMVWWAHFRFFRRYGLHDVGTIFLNAGLLFTVLFYVYPLKFLFFLVSHQVFRTVSEADPEIPRRVVHIFTSDAQVRELMTVYGAGFAAVYFLLAALHWNALRQREHLHLNALEVTLTKISFWDYFGVAWFGILCCVGAYVLPLRLAGYAPMAFMLISVYKTFHGSISGKCARRAHALTPADDRCAPVHHH